MKGKIVWLILTCLMVTALVLASCGPAAPTTTEPATAAVTVATPTLTPTPTATLTPTPTPTPTPPTFSGWGPVSWGSEFQATPGISSTTSKAKESKLEDGSTAIWYLLNTVPRFDPKDDQVYYIWGKSGTTADPPRQLPGTVKAGPFGLLGDEIDGVRYSLSAGVGHFAKGEAFEFAVANNDKTTVVFWKIIPAPIEVRQGIYRLWVELKSPDGKVFLAWGEGFEPNEEIDIVSTSDSEILSSKGKADADGRVMVALLPSVVGKTAGLASITLKGKAGEIKVSYEWGPPAVITQ